LRRVLRFAAMCNAAHSKFSALQNSGGFVKKYSREFKKDVLGVPQGALPALEAYDWSGNVRRAGERHPMRSSTSR
jgi:transcriptional regulator of aromatic amino acid metabolism